LSFFFTLLFSISFLQADVVNQTITDQQKLQNQSSLQVNAQNVNNKPYDLSSLKVLVLEKKSGEEEDLRVKNIQKQIQRISKNIANNVEMYFDEEDFANEYSFLKNKISINLRHDNEVAALRDEIKRDNLLNHKFYIQTIQKIINGKKSYKDKKYFIQLLDTQIKRLKSINLKLYETTSHQVQDNKDNISLVFMQQYHQLLTQIESHSLVFDYLKNNIAQYRTSNFILDDLSLKYFIQSINDLPGISYITEVTHYYTQITLGDIITALVLIYFFIFFSKKILPYSKSKIKQKLKSKYGKKGAVSYEYLHDSIALPFTLTIYVFAAQLGLSLLVSEATTLSKTTPWFNTAYLAIFTFLLYAFLKNAIHFYADNLFEKYPNVRKEMIDFLLRIGKVIVILFVLLFLFMQLGFDIQAILASLGIGGIAVALAAKDTLTNFFGSLNIITDNSFSQGDWIQAGDIEGTVVDIRMRTTRIRTFANAMITVPNAQLANTSILNWSKRRVGRRIKMSLGITYSSKMSDIQQLVVDIKEMLTHHEGIATAKIQVDDKVRNSNLLKKEDLIGVKKTLLVYIDEYDASSINILIYCFSRSPDWETWLEVKEDVIVKLNELVIKNNCDFAFPTQSIIFTKE